MGVTIDGNFTGGDSDDALPAPGDPMGVARVLIRDQQTATGELTLRHWRGSWMEWQENPLDRSRRQGDPLVVVPATRRRQVLARPARDDASRRIP